jgi:hypothetical protein
MTSPIRAVAAAVLVLSAGACSQIADIETLASTSFESSSALRTDSAVYTVRAGPQVYAVDIGVIFTNPLNRPVAVPACHNHYRPLLQKRVDGEWITAYAPVELMCITAPHVIGPHETYRFIFAVRPGMPDSNTWPRFETQEIPGTYRLLWFVGMHAPNTDTGVGQPLAEEHRTSNTFELRI